MSNAKRARLLRVHQSVGVLAVAFFTVTALTGLAMTFGHIFAKAPPAATQRELVVPMERMLDAASAQVEGAGVAAFYFPSEDRPVFAIDLDDTAHTRVYLEGDATVLRAEPEGRRRSVLALHTGRAAGIGGQLLAALSGLALLLMAYSGLMMARARRGRGRGRDRVAQARARHRADSSH